MTGTATTERNVYAEHNGANESYGLRKGVLGPVETLAQSVSAMAPSTSASLTIPLVFALAGNATWFVYLLATGVHAAGRILRQPVRATQRLAGIALHLHRKHAAAGIWRRRRLGIAARLPRHRRIGGRRSALLRDRPFASSSCTGRRRPFPRSLWSAPSPDYIAYRDVKLSAEVMLWIEAVSVSLIVIVLVLLPVHIGLQLDTSQFQLKDVSFSSLGPALVLSIFSFVGFRERNHAGRRSARSAAHHSPRGAAVRAARRRLLHALRVL